MSVAAAALRLAVIAAALAAGCIARPVENPDMLVVSMTNSPNNLDPRVGTDSFSAKTAHLMFNNLVELDENLRIAPGLAERLEHPTPTTYVATLRQGVLFHDGHELTADDVVYTFRSILDPAFVTAKKGGYRELASVEARDRYTVVFTLKAPFASFPINLLQAIVPAGSGPELRDHPIGTGPYRFVRYAVDDQLVVEAYPQYFGGPPRNAGIVLKITPDDVMRALELRKGAVDVVVNDLVPDIVHQLKANEGLRIVERPGVDYQYLAMNLRDPALSDVRVRRALAHAIDRDAIVRHLTRGFASPAVGLLPPMSWAFAPDVPAYAHDPARAKQLLDEAGYPDPDGDGPATRLHLTLKVSNTEFNRLQSTVIQQDLERVGVAVDVRTYEFATLLSDIVSGNFQTYTLQWTAGALADPDILRRVFHSSQTPPAGFNRGHFSDPQVDALLDEATASDDDARRRELYMDAQRVIARQVPYISLWYKTNFAVAQRSLDGIRLSPVADFLFLKDVARVRTAAN
jgi:peptide/nickel transport system substrate-binding protein